jgi:legumain
MKGIVIAIVLSLTILSATAANWAVLVAGSNGFWNYRHQADVCHAYQIMIGNGIPASNIITMAYDDIANDPSNPFPGQLFNKPSTGAGKDVYSGCQIDYTGADVTPQNFLALLVGDASAVGGKKVLNSTAEDFVFINFVDHGAAGLIAFPSDYLYADDLNNTLNTMYTNQMYNQLVFYLEACESGSMFDGILAQNINIYATTAANPDESSWATYCSPQDIVNGVEIGSCLGDLYSVNWMEDTDAAIIKLESLETQFTNVETETTLSHVMQYGDLDFDTEPIGDFQGEESSWFITSLFKPYDFNQPPKTYSVDCRDAKLDYLENLAAKTNSAENQSAVLAELQYRNYQDTYFQNLISATFGQTNDAENATNIAMGSYETINFACLKQAVASFENNCTSLGEYGLKYVRVFVNLCNTEFNGDLTTFISQTCESTTNQLSGVGLDGDDE